MQMRRFIGWLACWKAAKIRSIWPDGWSGWRRRTSAAQIQVLCHSYVALLVTLAGGSRSLNVSRMPQAQSAYQAAQLIGMPECDTILAQVVVHLAEAPKSTRVYAAYNSAKRLVASEPNYPVPLHIRNAPTRLMKELDYGKEYLYEPSFAHPVHQTFLPKELEGKGTFLQAEDSIEGKTVDLDRLQEWEKVHQKRWEGRENLELQLAVRDLEH